MSLYISTKFNINYDTEEMKLAAVNGNGYAIQHISNPSEEIKLAAVKQNGYAIQYMIDPSEEIKLAAVKDYGYAIKHIENPTEEMKLASVKENGYAIEYIANASEEVQLASLWIFEARKYVKHGLSLPTIHYKWIHDCCGLKYFEKNLKNRTKKYSDINIRC